MSRWRGRGGERRWVKSWQRRRVAAGAGDWQESGHVISSTRCTDSTNQCAAVEFLMNRSAFAFIAVCPACSHSAALCPAGALDLSQQVSYCPEPALPAYCLLLCNNVSLLSTWRRGVGFHCLQHQPLLRWHAVVHLARHSSVLASSHVRDITL